MSALVSVIIPTYNRADYIGEAIESVLAQTYSPLEIIVIDDGSTDNTSEIVARYAPRVRYIRQENAERGAARNHGLRLANGEFIAFIDSDDVWLPHKIEKDIEVFSKNPKAGLVYSDIQIIESSGKLRRILKSAGYSGTVTEQILKRNFVSVGAHLIKTHIIRDADGFREERKLSCSEDYETWVRLSTKTEFAYADAANVQIRVHPNNSVGNVDRTWNAAMYACDLFEEAGYLTPKQKKIIPETRSFMTLLCAVSCASTGDRTRALSLARQAFRYNRKIIFDPLFVYSLFKIAGGSAVSNVFYFVHRKLNKS